ncbi:MAG: hypothetical protein NTY19_09640, partial [Planctomycetota bacterium]|nr:hypothetical protein [Planctomycetota bacterium]
ATYGIHGYEVWKSDGTSAGTALVKDINVGTGSYPRNLTNVNGTLFFQATDGSHGYEVWKSDGTTAGTALVKDINVGTTGSYPRYLTNVNGTLFFRADDGSHGVELWGLVQAATTLTASVDGSGNLTVTDSDATGKNNQLTLRLTAGGDLVIGDATETFSAAPAGWTLSGDKTSISILASLFTGSITVTGGGGDDTLTVDFSNGNPLPSGGLTFNGGALATAAGDKLILLNTLATAFTTQVFHFADTKTADGFGGSVVINGTATITFTGLEPILGGKAADTTFNLPLGIQNLNVTIGDDSSLAGNNVITNNPSATFGTVSFPNPTNRLTVTLGNQGDTLALQSMDVGFAPAGVGGLAPFLVNGGSGADTVNVQATAVTTTLNANGGDDAITVSSDAPNTTTAGVSNLAGLAGTLNLNLGTGTGQTITVSDFGETATANTNVVVTSSAITGFAGVANGTTINYSADMGSTNTLTLEGSNTLADTFRVPSTNGLFTTTLNANGGNDAITVSSDAPNTTTAGVSNLAGLAGT